MMRETFHVSRKHRPGIPVGSRLDLCLACSLSSRPAHPRITLTILETARCRAQSISCKVVFCCCPGKTAGWELRLPNCERGELYVLFTDRSCLAGSPHGAGAVVVS